MALVEFTTHDDIRAALGVSNDELEDSTISLSIYEFNLKKELRELSPVASSVYATAAALPEGGRTAEQTQYFESVRLFATYAVAKHLCSALPLFSPKEKSDGKASAARYSTDPYKTTIASVSALYEEYRADALKSLEEVSPQGTAAPSIRTRPMFLAVGLKTNPVTNEAG